MSSATPNSHRDFYRASKGRTHSDLDLTELRQRHTLTEAKKGDISNEGE